MSQVKRSRSQRRRDKIVNGGADTDKSINKIMLIVFGVMILTFAVVLFVRNYEAPVEMKTPQEYNKTNTKTVVVEFTVENKSNFQIELYNDKMPNTVENFVNNIYTKAYVDRAFHRVDNYMLLAGGMDDEVDDMSSTELDFEENEEMKTVGRYSVGMVKHSETGNNSRLIFLISKATQETMEGEYSMFGKIIGVPSENVIDNIKLDDIITDCRIVSFDGVPYTGGYIESEAKANTQTADAIGLRLNVTPLPTEQTE